MKICIISTIKSVDPLDTVRFVNYHLKLGIDLIVLFLDDPADPIMEFLTGHISVHMISCDSAYWTARGRDAPAGLGGRQVINLNYGMKLAAVEGFDWMIHIDNDELLRPEDDIKFLLSQEQETVNSVHFFLKEAVAEQDQYDTIFAATLFRNLLPGLIERAVANDFLGCPQAFFEGEFFRSHTASKCAVRLDAGIEWMSVHEPERPRATPATAILTEQIELLHFDNIGFDSWRNKWAQRLTEPPGLPGKRPNRHRQRALFEQAYGNAANELALYSRLCKIPDREKRILMDHGLLSVVTLPPEMFEQPAHIRKIV
jgi:hypothetical protein